MAVYLDEAQREALKKMHNGCIVCGGVGSGKTRVGLAYYHCIIGKGRLKPTFTPMTEPVDLYIITTAATRDKYGWEREMVNFMLFDCHSGEVTDKNAKKEALYKTKVVVDSWNNIHKYVNVDNAFFIFDEQRVTGTGPWVKAFLKITQVNRWILLSATPGDKWIDYAPVFIANGYYKNITEFREMHVNYKRRGSYPQIVGYFGTRRLERLREQVLVDLPVIRDTVRHNVDICCEYDRAKYREIMRTRFDPFKEQQIENAPSLCQCLRKVVNSDPSRLNTVLDILDDHPKVILFYNYDYELEMLKDLFDKSGIRYSEWNGHVHQDILKGPKWVYLVHYFASEGWNCTTTDTMIFFSQNYSYKIMEQASGRIDRRNTTYVDLYYYHLKSKAPIDLAIARAIKEKKMFNEGRFFNRVGKLS